MADLIQIRRDTAANWTSVDPTLEQGEMGYEVDAKKLKFGDGSTAWSSLPYFASGAGALDDLTDVVITGVASGDLLRYNGTNWVNTVLVAGDIPNLAASKITSGQLALARGGSGADLSATGPGFLKQATLGSAVTVSALAAGDIPSLDTSKITTGTMDTARLGSGSASSSTWLRGDQTWASVSLADLAAGTLANATVLTFPSGQTGTSTDRQIYGDASGISYNAPSGLAHRFGRAGTALVTLGINGVTFLNTTGVTTAGNREIAPTYGGLYANVPTGTEFRIQVNASSHYRFSGSNFSIENNMYLKFVSTAATVTGSEKSLVPTSAGMVLNTPSSSSVALAVNATAVATFAAGSVTLADATNIVVHTTTGTKFGTGAGQKIGFWNAPPVAQQTGPTALSSRTAGASYTATEQTMIQEAHDTARLTLALMRTIGLAA